MADDAFLVYSQSSLTVCYFYRKLAILNDDYPQSYCPRASVCIVVMETAMRNQ